MKNFIAKALLYIKNNWVLKILINGWYYLLVQKYKKELSYKYLKWEWIEIWALMNPLPFNNKNTVVKYADYKSREELINEYPELKNFNIVETSYICWADDLNCIEDSTQDFVIASHVFEHLPNPIKALEEFHRITKKEWIIYLVVPEKTRTGDKFRSITSINHIIEDYKNPSSERDLEHYEEFVLDYEEFVLDYKNKEDKLKKVKVLQKKLNLFIIMFLKKKML